MSPDEGKTLPILLEVDPGEDASDEERFRLASQLRREILDLDVETVEPVKTGELPPGAKAGEGLELGMLMVELLPTVIPGLVGFLQSWVMRGENRKVKIKTQVGDRSVEMEFSPAAISQDEVKALVANLTEALQGPGQV